MRTLVLMDAWALITVDGGGCAFVRVAELNGVLVVCDTGVELDMVSLVWVDAAALDRARMLVA